METKINLHSALVSNRVYSVLSQHYSKFLSSSDTTISNYNGLFIITSPSKSVIDCIIDLQKSFDNLNLAL